MFFYRTLIACYENKQFNFSNSIKNRLAAANSDSKVRR